MKLSEIYKIADALAPKRLSDEYCSAYGAYDNSGILVDTGEDVKGVLFSLDLSSAAIAKAKDVGANLIITHHPAIYGKIANICEWNPLGKKLVECIKNGISVLSMHLNLDGVEGGIDDSLMQGVCQASGAEKGINVSVMHPLTGGGYGKAYDIKPCSLQALTSGIEKEFSTKRILCYGAQDREIKRVASFCGAGVDEGAIAFALRNEKGGADAILSSDFKHHLISGALEEGLAVIILTHYASENYGFQKYYEKICRQVNLPCVYHTDEHLL
ncbi:MAG: Nif3-like dinuclear metal center hexameric protein [Clostridia bacterium]|nr:Nif3-like dinuclear metal center hexameric protein [Clostridia bacterium]